MTLTVFDKNDNQIFQIKEFSVSSEHMGDSFISATVYSPNKKAFSVGDYVMYNGKKFSIFERHSGIKTAKTGIGIGDAMQYDLKFEWEARVLKDILFQDYVTKDDTAVYYTGTSTFYFFNNVTELAYRIQANLDRYAGEGVWNVSVSEDIELEEMMISVDKIYLWDGLLLANTQYGLDFFIDGKNIIIGGSGEQIPQTFYYGKNKGLYRIERNYEVGDKVITRLKAYGSDRNLPPDYLRDEDSKGRYFTRLMLPNFAYTGIDYVDAPQELIDEFGIIEGIKEFDIYPSIEEIDLGLGRIDEIVAVDEIDLESDHFYIHCRDFGFNPMDYLTSEKPRISIKGSNENGTPTHLGGYEFEIINAELIAGLYKIKLRKNQENSIILPDNVTKVRAGDRFVILGIFMPDSYITNAENKLLIKANEFFTGDEGLKVSYNVEVDSIFVQKNNMEFIFNAGKKAKIEDDDLDVANYFTIQNTTIEYGREIIPSFEIKLANVKTSTLKAEFNKTEIKQSNYNVVNKTTVNDNRISTEIKIKESGVTWQ